MVLYTVSAIFPRKLHTAPGRDNIKKIIEHMYEEKKCYFLYFAGLLRVLCLRDRDRESRRVYEYIRILWEISSFRPFPRILLEI